MLFLSSLMARAMMASCEGSGRVLRRIYSFTWPDPCPAILLPDLLIHALPSLIYMPNQLEQGGIGFLGIKTEGTNL
jgi:hypothetical protein